MPWPGKLAKFGRNTDTRKLSRMMTKKCDDKFSCFETDCKCKRTEFPQHDTHADTE